MLLLRKFLKSSFKESVVSSKWSAFWSSPRDLQVRELWSPKEPGTEVEHSHQRGLLCEARS